MRKHEGAALRRELVIGRILDDTQAVANEAAAAASAAQEEAATARADAAERVGSMERSHRTRGHR